MGLADEALPSQYDRDNWPHLRDRRAIAFRGRTRAQWCAVLEGTDACFAPVLDLEEAASHPHNVARANLVNLDGLRNPAPAPRFSRTPSALRTSPPAPGQDGIVVHRQLGLQPE